jgi:hypothetical protein
MSSNVALRYYLPKTVLEVSAQVRYVVVFDSVGGHLEPRVDVRVVPLVVPDRTARCCTTLDAGVLESASLGVQLTPEGLIDAVGSHVTGHAGCRCGTTGLGRTSAGSAPRTAETDNEEAAELAHRAAWTRPGSLRTAFNKTHPRTNALIADLSARAEQFLAGMRMGDGPAEVEMFGSALAVVERELAAADRMRREWIAAQGFGVRSGQWQVDLGSAVTVAEPLPETLPGDTPVAGGPVALLARDYGVLIAVADPERSEPAPTIGDEEYQRVDELLLRQARPVTVAAYRRTPVGIGAAGDVAAVDGEWILDRALTQHLETVDARSLVHAMGPEGHLGNDRALNVTFYPSGSVRTFGVAATATVAPSGGGLVTPAGETGGATGGMIPSQSAVAAAALDAARLQLALLQASDEFTRLAATHAHGGELATLEQDARFAALRARLG